MELETANSKIDTCPPLTAGNKVDVAPIARMQQVILQQGVGIPVLALGAENDSSFCLCEGRQAQVSPPFGKLTEPETYRRFVKAITGIISAHGDKIQIIAHDLHPSYLTTQLARRIRIPAVSVQHHHAHLVSVMADWGITQPIMGVCCDGMGYGDDGAAWGCELMHCTRERYERIGHLEYFPLIGGDRAAVENWRPAVALLRQSFGSSWRRNLPRSFVGLSSNALMLVDATAPGGDPAARTPNAPMTSSLGRIFDGVSFILGLCERNDQSAQAAIALESAADVGSYDPYPYAIRVCSGMIQMSVAPAIRALVRDQKCGTATGWISARFHETVASMLATAVRTACESEGRSAVVLSGGCFANARLRRGVVSRLENFRLRVYLPRRLSVGDAGLSLGQAVIAATRRKEAV